MKKPRAGGSGFGGRSPRLSQVGYRDVAYDMTKLGRLSDGHRQHGHEQDCVIAGILAWPIRGCPAGRVALPLDGRRLAHEPDPIAEGRDEGDELRARRFIGEHAALVELAAGSADHHLGHAEHVGFARL
jgi:hypothetical protein